MSTTDNNTSHDGDQVSALRLKLKTLNVQREALEYESEAITSELNYRDPEQPNIPPMGVDTPLVDNEGFPRNDIDVFRARTLRNRLMILRTDHKQLMHEIDTSLQQLAMLQQTPEYKTQLAKEEELRRNPKPKPKYDPVSGKWVVRNWDGTIAGIPTTTTTSNGEPRSFDEIQEVSPGTIPPLNEQYESEATTTDVSMSETGDTQHDFTNSLPSNQTIQMIHRAAVSISDCHKNPSLYQPLARVDSVADNSPASLAGLKINDVIIAFGPMVKDSFGTDSLSTLVQSAAVNQEMIEIICQRSNNDNDDDTPMYLLLQLSPRPWPGRGFLGCHIVPC
jgi:hypothetical protein